MTKYKDKTWTHEDLWGTKPELEQRPGYMVVSSGLGQAAQNAIELPQFYPAILITR